MSPQLLLEIKKVNFTVNTTQIFFNPDGDPMSLGYDILYWNMSETRLHSRIKNIGEYWPVGKIKLPKDLVRARNVTVRSTF